MPCNPTLSLATTLALGLSVIALASGAGPAFAGGAITAPAGHLAVPVHLVSIVAKPAIMTVHESTLSIRAVALTVAPITHASAMPEISTRAATASSPETAGFVTLAGNSGSPKITAMSGFDQTARNASTSNSSSTASSDANSNSANGGVSVQSTANGSGSTRTSLGAKFRDYQLPGWGDCEHKEARNAKHQGRTECRGT
jgi:hypothetical protein